MSAVHLYFDADAMQRAVLQGLRARGVDATAANEAGMAGATDERQLEFATNQGRTLFSFNISDFQRYSPLIAIESPQNIISQNQT